MTALRRFAFRLALASGYWVYNPDAMLARMPNRIFTEWMQFEQEEPFGQIPLRLGYGMAMLGNLWGRPRGRRAWRASDFMPDAPQKRTRSTSAEQQVPKIIAIAKMLGAEIIDPKGILKDQ